MIKYFFKAIHLLLNLFQCVTVGLLYFLIQRADYVRWKIKQLIQLKRKGKVLGVVASKLSIKHNIGSCR